MSDQASAEARPVSQASTAVTSSPGRTRRTATWGAMHSVEIVFFTLLGALLVHALSITANTYFQFDDWRLILQGGSWRGLLEPYNDHPSMTLMAIYQISLRTFGFSYTALRVVGIVALLAVPAAYFLTTRRLLGPPIAAIAALSMLSFGNLEFYPAVLNHYLVVVGAIGCAAALNRRENLDWVLAVALSIALSAAGGGIAVAAACVMHNACRRPAVRRWVVVLAPCGVWASWWLLIGRVNKSTFRPTVDPSPTQALRYAGEILWTPFEHIGLGNQLLGAILVAAFVGYGAWQLRHGGFSGAATFLAWSTAMIVWAVGLAYGRGAAGVGGDFIRPGETAYRYAAPMLCFALLAVVPRKPVTWPARVPLASSPRWLVAAATIILAVSIGRSMGMRDELQARATWTEGFGRLAHSELLVLELGPTVVPDEAALSAPFFGLRAGTVRGLVARYDDASPVTPSSADRGLVDLGHARARLEPVSAVGCRRLDAPIIVESDARRPIRLWSDQPNWKVEVRRFSDDWITVAGATAGQGVSVKGFPVLGVDRPWQVRAEGACRAQ